jgi:phenylpropionate dioxygenase-like ring-hydroxylating dioxygenase large terminal subunit
VAAADDRCAHRGFPLSHGRVVGDNLVCGYHGCTYDSSGVCVTIPSQTDVPPAMVVKVYPVVEEPPFIWVWLGPPAAATGRTPPVTPWIGEPGWTTFAKSWRVEANYMMFHEHYLDFTYAPVVHPDDLPPGLRSLPALDEVEVTETSVSYTRVLPEAGLADWEAEGTDLDRALTYVRRESGTFASPALHMQRWEIDCGETRYSNIRTQAVTPESPTSTRVFLQASRNYALDQGVVTNRLSSHLDGLAQRDTAILEMVTERVGYEGWRSGVELKADAAALRARRIVSVMLAVEAGRSPVRPGLLSVHRPDASPN